MYKITTSLESRCKSNKIMLIDRYNFIRLKKYIFYVLDEIWYKSKCNEEEQGQQHTVAVETTPHSCRCSRNVWIYVGPELITIIIITP